MWLFPVGRFWDRVLGLGIFSRGAEIDGTGLFLF